MHATCSATSHSHGTSATPTTKALGGYRAKYAQLTERTKEDQPIATIVIAVQVLTETAWLSLRYRFPTICDGVLFSNRAQAADSTHAGRRLCKSQFKNLPDRHSVHSRQVLTSTAHRAESRTSAYDSRPVSGAPARAAATLKPLKKPTSKPVGASNVSLCEV